MARLSAVVALVASIVVGVDGQTYCPNFDPSLAEPCTDAPKVGDICTIASQSERIRPGQPALGFMLRDCKVSDVANVARNPPWLTAWTTLVSDCEIQRQERQETG